MPRYIDAEQKITVTYYDEEYEEWSQKTKTIDDFISENADEEIPTADVVEVVRCKDCRHLEVLNGVTYYARCKWNGRLFGSFGRADTRTWFCADGERRDDGEIH